MREATRRSTGNHGHFRLEKISEKVYLIVKGIHRPIVVKRKTNLEDTHEFTELNT
jgi:hypothetical protein